MSSQKNSHLTAMFALIKRAWSELDEANRRIFDIRVDERFVERQADHEPRGHRARERMVPTR